MRLAHVLPLPVIAALLTAGCATATDHQAATPRAVTVTPVDNGSPTASEITQARRLLPQLPVKGRAPKTGYSRDQFGQAWSDDVTVPLGHNGCDTRNDILHRDLTGLTFKPGTHDCVVLSGTLADPYTGKTIAFRRGKKSSTAIQIDHLVPLSNAFQTGAQQLTPDQRRNLANDPAELLAVDGPTNEAKGDGDAATWLPPNKAYRCTYVSKQIIVKAKYHLWVTPAEHDAMARVLASCTSAS